MRCEASQLLHHVNVSPALLPVRSMAALYISTNGNTSAAGLSLLYGILRLPVLPLWHRRLTPIAAQGDHGRDAEAQAL